MYVRYGCIVDFHPICFIRPFFSVPPTCVHTAATNSAPCRSHLRLSEVLPTIIISLLPTINSWNCSDNRFRELSNNWICLNNWITDFECCCGLNGLVQTDFGARKVVGMARTIIFRCCPRINCSVNVMPCTYLLYSTRIMITRYALKSYEVLLVIWHINHLTNDWGYREVPDPVVEAIVQ